jgi:hypothetical protein
VRPNPVAISSKISITWYSSQSPRKHAQQSWVVETHATRALYDRLDDDGRQLVRVRRHGLLEFVHIGTVRTLPAVGRRIPATGSTPVHSECMPPSGSHTLIGWKVSPWYPPRHVSQRCFSGRPSDRQYCRHILMATSTETEPESARKHMLEPSV